MDMYSFLSVWVRESPSLWAFPFILICHTVGMGIPRRYECGDGSANPRICAAGSVIAVPEVFSRDAACFLCQCRIRNLASDRISDQGSHESFFLHQVVPDRICIDPDAVDPRSGPAQSRCGCKAR